MFKGFKLTLNEADFLSSNGEYSNLLREKKDRIVDKFNEVLLSNGKIDADKIIDEWFPAGEYHVFISHSHKDRELAEKFANWLYDKFRLTSFLDSHVWGYANNLLKELNEKYASNGGDGYVYESAISNAAHVYLMLSTALTEAIDKSECLFFINTENTLENMKIEGGHEESRTASPWIMHELKMSAMIRRHLSADRKEQTTKGFWLEELKESASFSFSVPTEHLFKIDIDSLLTWLSDCGLDFNLRTFAERYQNIENQKKEFDALDSLYSIVEDNKDGSE